MSHYSKSNGGQWGFFWASCVASIIALNCTELHSSKGSYWGISLKGIMVFPAPCLVRRISKLVASGAACSFWWTQLAPLMEKVLLQLRESTNINIIIRHLTVISLPDNGVKENLWKWAHLPFKLSKGLKRPVLSLQSVMGNGYVRVQKNLITGHRLVERKVVYSPSFPFHYPWGNL